MEWLAVQFPTVKSSLYLMEILARWARASYGLKLIERLIKKQEQEQDTHMSFGNHEEIAWPPLGLHVGLLRANLY